ncbi:hypothetical protein ACU4GI_27840 [Cupriavidus basilensis]|uniref:hypothetical protein n=1 Tax=Cupriavidus basilensis TaxID=68895 RepID=UPI0023E86CA2|nr:hypothetical protein [Cupriavidus basilensis]MDF3882853.1 hypothetical protein [Cupriavidus basilensis]
MKKTLWGLLLTSCTLLAILGGCASQSNEGRESSITAYGVVDVGISRTSEK